ncbi:hypothetical protein KSP39_PZI011330 [Platanthera zijinensis]|uniref:Uncharacterized protein n=1 Tax=Platanthera zijinensis TaxID=2320716 RepID=A0AAP0BGF3_9ASPA
MVYPSSATHLDLESPLVGNPVLGTIMSDPHLSRGFSYSAFVTITSHITTEGRAHSDDLKYRGFAAVRRLELLSATPRSRRPPLVRFQAASSLPDRWCDAGAASISPLPSGKPLLRHLRLLRFLRLPLPRRYILHRALAALPASSCYYPQRPHTSSSSPCNHLPPPDLTVNLHPPEAASPPSAHFLENLQMEGAKVQEGVLESSLIQIIQEHQQRAFCFRDQAAYYSFVEKIFSADVVLHFGTHGPLVNIAALDRPEDGIYSLFGILAEMMRRDIKYVFRGSKKREITKLKEARGTLHHQICLPPA